MTEEGHDVRRLTYTQARALLLVLVTGLAAAIAAMAWTRGAAATEILAPLLYAPVVAGAVLLGLPGALVAATAASGLYALVLAGVAGPLGLGAVAGLFGWRVFTYYLFGIAAAVGVRSIERRLHKLEVYDQIDDETGLFNSAFFLQDTDLELSRADRYRTVFSVVDLDLARTAFRGLSRRRRVRLLRELAGQIRGSVRLVDRAARVADSDRERFMVVLPETGREGATVFAQRLEDATRGFFARRGVTLNGYATTRALTYPDDPAALARIRAEVERVEASRRVVRDD